MFSESRPLSPADAPPVELYVLAIELRRPGVVYDVDRARDDRDNEDTVRGTWAGLKPGVCGVMGLVICWGLSKVPLEPGRFSSSSVHCRCRMTDLVAHWSKWL